MTKREWLIDVVSRIEEDNKILVWAIMSEDDDSFQFAIGEDATGGQQMLLAANMLKHMAKNLKTSPIGAAKAALAYDAMKDALKETAGMEADDDDQ